MLGTGLVPLLPCFSQEKKQKDERPNIIVVMVDDMGWSDLGCFGGEMNTPNIDGLADNGVRFTNMYNAGRSCPSRASLLTGLYPHQAGIGRMTFNQNLPGYIGSLSDNAVTIAQVLKSAGYNTGMVGKWHVSETPLKEDQREWLAHQRDYSDYIAPSQYPTAKGFDYYYGVLYGVVNFFDPFSLVYGDKPVKEVPSNYYITDALSDSAVAYVNRNAKLDKPFFLYLAHTAPHWPLHALPEDIDKYKDRYKGGWESIREERYDRIKKMDLLASEDEFLSKQNPDREWMQNKDSVWDARAMAVHAAMIDRVDQGIGRLIKTLKDNGALDNTLILFMSDNGCSPEVCQNYSPGDNDRPDMMRNGEPIIYPKQKEVLPGPQNTFASLGASWANVANTPFRFWKAKTYEGGICTPFIAHYPKGINMKKGSVYRGSGHLMDIMATAVELAGARYPERYGNNNIIPIEGKSLVPAFKKGKREGHNYLFFEHFRERAVVSGDWKIVAPNKKPWELYNLKTDRTEMHNLADQYPDIVTRLNQAYDEWAVRALVEPSPK
ncbi:arylsulfatase [Dysgonomonas termitidis]|uniref:Arylsulfatase n=1 Tax=Dysgonomonas termitidis TaxID=1516126 RepID=A0ABV9L626_9BACT